jgi:protein transport protein SEC23
MFDRSSGMSQVFNNSPDETAYFRMVLNRETVVNSLVMIQVRSPVLADRSLLSASVPTLYLQDHEAA